MSLSATDTSDENAVVLINEDGLATYGRLPEDARKQMTTEEHETLEEKMQGVLGTMDDLREKATELLQEMGYGSLQWPLSDEAMQKIREGEDPPGLLLTRTNSPIPRNGTT